MLIMGFESRDYARDGRYTASLSRWGQSLTPVVKYLIIANVVVFLLQIVLTRPAEPQLPDFDAISSDEEEIATDTERPAPRKDANTKDDRQSREKKARKAREAMEEILSRLPGSGLRSSRNGSNSTRRKPSSTGRSGGS